MLRILHFTSSLNSQEYVVLTEDEGADIIEEYRTEGFKLQNDIVTDGDSLSLPTDRPLWPKM